MRKRAPLSPMKKTKNTPTRSKLTQPNAYASSDTNPAHAAGKDTRLLVALPPGAFERIKAAVKAVAPKKKYEAKLSLLRTCRATVTIEAASVQEAYEKADSLCPSEVPDWELCNWEIFVSDITPTGGKNDE